MTAQEVQDRCCHGARCLLGHMVSAIDPLALQNFG